jgi:hypothetical protein
LWAIGKQTKIDFNKAICRFSHREIFVYSHF